jgi:hypothetical protein
MATIKKEEIDKELLIALQEVGPIQPWFDRKVMAWVFEHPLYPVRYAGDSSPEVVENYPKYLEVFIEHRLQDRIGVINERKTKGKGGARPGAGRPKGSVKEATKQVRLPIDIADWLKSPGIVEHLRYVMEAYPKPDRRISPATKGRNSPEGSSRTSEPSGRMAAKRPFHTVWPS